MRIGARDHDFARLDRLAQGFQNRTGEFGKLVHEQNTVMRQADFARLRPTPTTNDGGHGGGVVRFAKWARPVDAALVQKPGEGVDHRRFQRLERGQGRQDAGQTGRQHGFARPRRADHHQVVASGRGNLQRAFGAFLAFDITQVF